MLRHPPFAGIRRRVLVVPALALTMAGASLSCLDRDISTLSPQTTNLFINKVPYDPVDKIDIAFMIDNSLSMADKQVMLSQAVPDMMRRLIEPLCTDEDRTVRERPLVGGGCRDGLKPEFKPVRDIHAAVISSSLGGVGENHPCNDVGHPTNNDRAHLIGTLRPDVVTYQSLGFLAWDPDAKKTPPGESVVETFTEQLRALVEVTGEDGCGYEASLESWYRFLIQPDPPAELVEIDGVITPEGLDEELLKQRRDFLRPDSLVAIVMLSDENDCSVAVGHGNYMINKTMPRGTAACSEVGPEDPCCRPCTIIESAPPLGCLPIAQDPACSAGMTHSAETDSPNVRCFDQKRRYGMDLLYPVERYIGGLTTLTAPDRNGNLVPNPLFVDESAPDLPPRSTGLVFLAGIVGVPWQDVATEESISGDGLEYLTAQEIDDKGRWPLLVGEDGSAPTDPFMRGSIEPRTAGEVNPIVQQPIVAPGAGTVNSINGHEYYHETNFLDLQYACIYPLASPEICSADTQCDCDDAPEKPLCRDPNTGTYGATQYFAKAYPGTRQLEVLRGIEEQAIVASICPKVYADQSNPSYGYGPAVQAIIDRLGEVLTGTCLPRDLDVDPDLGTVPCKVIEALPPSTDPAVCTTPGRTPIEPELRASVEKELREGGQCDNDPMPACADLVMCRITQAQTEGDAALASCQNDAVPNASGFCYVDAARGIGNPDLVSGCGATEKRLVRLVSADPAHNPLPRKGATVFVACRGKGANTASD